MGSLKISKSGHRCGVCGKGKQKANKVSHAKNRTHFFRKPNLHIYNLVVDGKKVRVKMCTKCRKTMKRTEVEKTGKAM